jgi:cytoskeletal protein RodZ
MGQFGSELRLERERRGVSLETMCALTKLSLRQLLDLEAENYDQLPGGVFRKGFVRSYLGAIGLDEPQWLERFEASYKASGMASSDEIDWHSFAENVRNGRVARQQGQTRGRWLALVGVLVVLSVAGWALWHFVVHPRLHVSLSRAQATSPIAAPILVSVPASIPVHTPNRALRG